MDIETIIQNTIPDDGNWIYGYADLRGLLIDKYASHPYAISIGRRLDDLIIDDLSVHGPTPEYYGLYHLTNDHLNSVVRKISDSLIAEGIPHTPIQATLSDDEITADFSSTLSFDFSHKMAATRAGIGWIGKTDLLVSERFGPRLRLATILIDHDLPVCSAPIEESRCGQCDLCVVDCPAKAASGVLWKAGMKRESFYDAHKCRKKCRELTLENIGKNESLCGICVSVCPVGRAAI